MNILSMYDPQAGRREEDKDRFWEGLMSVLVEIPKEVVILDGGFEWKCREEE